jgi:hypothetical protein
MFAHLKEVVMSLRIFVVLTCMAVLFSYSPGWCGSDTAEEEQVQELMSLSIAVIGQGRVKGKGIDCSSSCTLHYKKRTVIVLDAVPSTEWTFVEWTGDCSGSGQCSVTMVRDMEVTAIFTFP